jgi:hypothetical protein
MHIENILFFLDDYIYIIIRKLIRVKYYSICLAYEVFYSLKIKAQISLRYSPLKLFVDILTSNKING